jgi:hypothetical protein
MGATRCGSRFFGRNREAPLEPRPLSQAERRRVAQGSRSGSASNLRLATNLLTLTLRNPARNSPDPPSHRIDTIDRLLVLGRPGDRPYAGTIVWYKYLRIRRLSRSQSTPIVNSWPQNGDLRNEPNCPLHTVTAAPKPRFAKRTQLPSSHCHRGVKMAIYETNPTALFTLSPRELRERTGGASR